jgi:hypothetical protein
LIEYIETTAIYNSTPPYLGTWTPWKYGLPFALLGCWCLNFHTPEIHLLIALEMYLLKSVHVGEIAVTWLSRLLTSWVCVAMQTTIWHLPYGEIDLLLILNHVSTILEFHNMMGAKIDVGCLYFTLSAWNCLPAGLGGGFSRNLLMWVAPDGRRLMVAFSIFDVPPAQNGQLSCRTFSPLMPPRHLRTMGLPTSDSTLSMTPFTNFALLGNVLWVYPEVNWGSTYNLNPGVLAPLIQIVWERIVGLTNTHKTHFG